MSEVLNISDESLRIVLKIRMSSKPKIFLCIGTPTHTWDSYGPMVGSLLKENKIMYVGDMDNPIDAHNVEEAETIIRNKYPDYELIAIDAAVTHKEYKANKVWVKDKGLKPGEAYSRNLNEIGDYSILYGIHYDEKDDKDHSKPFKAAIETVQIIKKILE